MQFQAHSPPELFSTFELFRTPDTSCHLFLERTQLEKLISELPNFSFMHVLYFLENNVLKQVKPHAYAADKIIFVGNSYLSTVTLMYLFLILKQSLEKFSDWGQDKQFVWPIRYRCTYCTQMKVSKSSLVKVPTEYTGKKTLAKQALQAASMHCVDQSKPARNHDSESPCWSKVAGPDRSQFSATERRTTIPRSYSALQLYIHFIFSTPLLSRDLGKGPPGLRQRQSGPTNLQHST